MNEHDATEILNFKFAYDAGRADAVQKIRAFLCEQSENCGNAYHRLIYNFDNQIAKELTEGK